MRRTYISLFEILDGAPGFIDDSHALMANDITCNPLVTAAREDKKTYRFSSMRSWR
jgi:hypothetical protein